MQLKHTEKYTLITQKSSPLKAFINVLNENLKQFEKAHIIVNILNTISLEDLSLFVKIAAVKQEQNTSFVLLCKDIDIDKVPDALQVAPTLEEAIDIINMDNMVRDLGF